MNENTNCPCGSGNTFTDCCEPFISGSKKADTPEILMRSRYTAFAHQSMPYLLETLHPSSRNDYDEAGSKKWASEAEWQQLEIVNVAKSESHANRETVEFKAHYKRDGNRVIHHEIAEFRKTDDTWYFFDGKMASIGQVKRETPKVGRNEPCPCGSGKKFKKCCGG